MAGIRPYRAAPAGLLCLLAAMALLAVGPAAGGEPRSLLVSSAPGAFGVRYLPDRAVMTCTVRPPEGAPEDGSFTLSVFLPQPIRWLHLDAQPADPGRARWHEETSMVELAVPFGSHRLQLGWAGSGKLAPESAELPVTVDGQARGELRARFTLQGMEATGSLPLGPGRATLRLKTAGELAEEELSVTCGDTAITRWRRDRDGLVSREPVLLPPQTALVVRVNRYALEEPPLSELNFEGLERPTAVERVDDTIPDGAILVEGEAFTDAGGSPVRVEPGSHVGAHGGACVFTFQGDGAWLQWSMKAPRAGEYDLYARVSCGDEAAFRAVLVDGAEPPGLSLVQFPGTGGWGHAEGEWWLVRLTGGPGGPPPLTLSEGEHLVRFTGILGPHLNVDYVLLVPRP